MNARVARLRARIARVLNVWAWRRYYKRFPEFWERPTLNEHMRDVVIPWLDKPTRKR